MDNPYIREASKLQETFVGATQIPNRIEEPEVKAMSFKQLIAEYTDLSFPAKKGLKFKLNWAEKHFGDRLSSEDLDSIPKSKGRAWKKWKKLIGGILIEDNPIDIGTIEPVLKPDTTPVPSETGQGPLPDGTTIVNKPEPEVIVNPMPPVVEPQSTPVDITVEVKPEIIVNPMPPIVEPQPIPVEPAIEVKPLPEPEIIVNPMPPATDLELIPTEQTDVVNPKPEPEIIVNPMPPATDLELIPTEQTDVVNPQPEPEIIVNPMPPVTELELEKKPNPIDTAGEIKLEIEPDVIVNPMPPMIELEPEIIVNPMPPANTLELDSSKLIEPAILIESTPFAGEIFGMTEMPNGEIVCGYMGPSFAPMPPLVMEDILNVDLDNLDDALCQLSPALTANYSLAQPEIASAIFDQSIELKEELVKHEVILDQ